MRDQKVTEAQERMGVLEVYGVGLVDDDPKNKLIEKAISENLFGGGHISGLEHYDDNKTLVFLPDFSKEELQSYKEEQKAAGKKKSSSRIEQVITELIVKAEFKFLSGANPDLYIAGGPLQYIDTIRIASETGRNVFFGSGYEGAKVKFDTHGGMLFESKDSILKTNVEGRFESIGEDSVGVYFPESSKMNAIIDSFKFERSEEEIEQDRKFLDAVEIMGNCPETMKIYGEHGGHDVVDVASGQKDAFVYLKQIDDVMTIGDKIKSVVAKLGEKWDKTSGHKAVLAISGGMTSEGAAKIAKNTGSSIVYAFNTRVDVRTLKGSIILTTQNAKCTFGMVDSEGKFTNLSRQIRIHKSRAIDLKRDFETPITVGFSSDDSEGSPPRRLLPLVRRTKGQTSIR